MNLLASSHASVGAESPRLNTLLSVHIFLRSPSKYPSFYPCLHKHQVSLLRRSVDVIISKQHSTEAPVWFLLPPSLLMPLSTACVEALYIKYGEFILMAGFETGACLFMAAWLNHKIHNICFLLPLDNCKIDDRSRVSYGILLLIRGLNSVYRQQCRVHQAAFNRYNVDRTPTVYSLWASQQPVCLYFMKGKGLIGQSYYYCIPRFY